MKSNYQKWIHKFGISTSLLLLAAMIGLPVAASLIYGIWPDFGELWPGFVAVVLFMAPYLPSETIGYMSVIKGKKEIFHYLIPLAVCLFFCYCTKVASAYYMLIVIAVSAAVAVMDYLKTEKKEERGE